MIEIVSYLLQMILIVIAIAVVIHKRNFTIIILIATFGLVAASLYIINKAPDVAIAEVAIGSAIIPLIYVISISRQREFIVLDRTNDGFIEYGFELSGEGYQILSDFVKEFDLSLNICVDIHGQAKKLIEELNVDLIVTKDEKTQQYVFYGKASSVLMTKLKNQVKDKPYIKIITLKEEKKND